MAITTLDFSDNETTTFWVGTEEGNVYQANRYDRAGAKAGLNQYDVYKGHAGPIMGLHFHPLVGPVDFSDLFLTSSVDWTVKLWRAKSLAKPSTAAHTISPLYSFDEADDYVYDVKWHPAHPAVFGTVDGSGQFDLWNLNTDTEVCFLFITNLKISPSQTDFYSCALKGSSRVNDGGHWSRNQQVAMGSERRSKSCSGWQRWQAIYLRHWGYGYTTRNGMDRHAEDCSINCWRRRQWWRTS